MTPIAAAARAARAHAPGLARLLVLLLLASSGAPVLAQDAGHGAAAGSAAHPADAGHEEEYDIIHHIVDAPALDFAPFGEIHLPRLEVFGIDLSITKHVVFLWLAAALMLAIFLPMGRHRGPVRKGVGNFFEAFVVYIRDQVAVGNIGKEDANRYVPYLLTLFFFILFMNLLGLVPFGSTATSNLMVTGTLGLISFVVAEASSIGKLGPGAYVKQFIPVQLESKGIGSLLFGLAIGGLLFLIEVISHLIRPLTLMIRLWANMIAGHTVILALLGLIFILGTYVVAPFAVGGAVAVYMLEIFIALVQAFIFTFLTALYIGMALHPHH